MASELRVDVQYAIELDNLPVKKEFHKWVAAVLDGISDPLEVVIRIVGIDESANLNQTYRGKQGPTNVLSFAVDAPPETGVSLLGDLVICGPVVQQEAREQGKEEPAHWAHMVVHGALHLLGYDHEEDVQAERMEQKEMEIMENLGFGHPYG